MDMPKFIIAFTWEVPFQSTTNQCIVSIGTTLQVMHFKPLCFLVVDLFVAGSKIFTELMSRPPIRYPFPSPPMARKASYLISGRPLVSRISSAFQTEDGEGLTVGKANYEVLSLMQTPWRFQY